MTITLRAEPLTRERFAPYGEVIETSRDGADAMNSARFERFDDLCKIDMIDDSQVAVSIARCRTPTSLPLRLGCCRKGHGLVILRTRNSTLTD